MGNVINNFKRMTLFRFIGVLMAILVIVGVFPKYVTFDESFSCSLIEGLPIGGVIIIVASLITVLGVALGKKIVSIIGSGVIFVSNIIFTFIVKTEDFYYKIAGVESNNSGVDAGAAVAEAGGFSEEYQNSIDEIDGTLSDAISDSASFQIGFYIILIASLIALAVFIIDIIKGDKEIEKRVRGKAESTVETISGIASSVMSNTSSEYSGYTEGNFNRMKFSGKNEPWICGSCGSENDARSKFCVYCGEERPRPKTCYKCGTLLEEHMMFCPKCGTKYDAEKSKMKETNIGDTIQENVCIYCGAKLPDGASFCGKCGRRQ